MKKQQYWDKFDCLEFLRRFDAFEHKYLNIGDGNNESLTDSFDKAAHEIWSDVLNSQGHSIANHNFSTKEEAEAAQGIKQVYCDEKHYANEYIEMLDLVRDKFIYDYTGIEGLCDFFSPAYFEYEWGMHLEIDYDKHTSRFYRDHYAHQIRNMFEMFSLLDNLGYYEKCKEAYLDPENNIGTFIAEAINQEILAMNATDKELYGKILSLRNTPEGKGIRAAYKDLDGSYFNTMRLPTNCSFGEKQQFIIVNEHVRTGSFSSFWRGASDNNRQELRDLMLHYVVYSAAIIASLVHDIGYPISYIRRVSDRLNKHLPVNRLLASTTKDYSEIVRALQNSLLFSVVDAPEKIEHRLNSSEEHGAQSAVVLLMYFHKHGEGLTILQRCAIELAALVIYNHTNKFSVINKAKEGKPETIPELVRSDIYKEPLSHIFRMCDDLQEWDRVYFEITDKNSIMVCPKCKTPITRRFGTDTCEPNRKKYYCCCNYDPEYKPQDPASDSNEGTYDTNEFVSRRILNVIGCNHMEVEKDDAAKYTKFTMNYDCGALLNIMTFSTSYGLVRANGVRDLKRLHSYQGQHDSILVDYFVSGNPLTVKLQIFKALMHYKKSNILSRCWINDNNWFRGMYKQRIVGYISDSYKSKNDIVNELWQRNVNFYYELFKKGSEFYDYCEKRIAKLIRGSGSIAEKVAKISLNTTNEKTLSQYKKVYELIIEDLESEATARLKRGFGECRSNEFMLAMCCDYLLQQAHILGFEKTKESLAPEIREEGAIKEYNIYRQFYENLYCSNAHLCNLVDSYISRDAYDRVKELCRSTNPNIEKDYRSVDFFVDYALFLDMWNDVKECREFFFVSGKCRPDTSESKHSIPEEFRYFPIENPDEVNKIALQCLTNETFFRDKYVFRVLKKEDSSIDGKLLGIEINWDELTGTWCVQEENLKAYKNELYALLSPLEKHHCIKLELSEQLMKLDDYY